VREKKKETTRFFRRRHRRRKKKKALRCRFCTFLLRALPLEELLEHAYCAENADRERECVSERRRRKVTKRERERDEVWFCFQMQVEMIFLQLDHDFSSTCNSQQVSALLEEKAACDFNFIHFLSISTMEKARQ
jgi:hypothetical protein